MSGVSGGAKGSRTGSMMSNTSSFHQSHMQQSAVSGVARALRTMRLDFVHHYMLELGPGDGVMAARNVTASLVADF